MIGLDNWLVTWLAPSHYLNQCWIVVNWTLRNKFQWNLNQNSNIFIQENVFEMSSAKRRPFCLGLNVFIKGAYSSSWQAEYFWKRHMNFTICLFDFKFNHYTSTCSYIYIYVYIYIYIYEWYPVTLCPSCHTWSLLLTWIYFNLSID